jgi:hypothetical protein
VYKPEFYFWECVILARRVLLVGLTVALSARSQAVLFMWLSLVNVLFLFLHMMLFPFVNPQDNYVEVTISSV